ncbi:type II toxin-antitoxin system HipA family toxin [Pseudoalteromonas sp. SWXJZ94C]|uniref:type II toxin-antitoxin system HipA family toxin n=1 Tax=Pseudoalteromonas sp. SWXJZ94C TaxID=2792065 RepID=UPI0018CE952D|nr:HipA domain-containing protein [Pseudoalteromonas sp. SWXJZ94C]MBH0056663.1 type II toxin-antitoxin system HipA family toxin [Pseudoalteromonas sp. SWXJZ94C]
MTSECYVFIDGLESKPVICGFYKLDTKIGRGEFNYGKSYLARADAFALDPIHLPLKPGIFNYSANKGVFGVLSDAGADSWGRKLILSLHTTKPQNELEFLLAGSGFGVGALVFSLSRSASKHKTNKNTLADLALLDQAKNDLLENKAISNEAKKAFEFGQSMGGARPKTSVQIENKLYLAKFNRPDDLFNLVRAEHATMCMAKELGIRAANTCVHATKNGDVLLVERFDVGEGLPTHHFLSANSLLQKSKVALSDLATYYSYGELAEFIRHNTGVFADDSIELYKRMVFNAFIGNTDDHTRNHAFLYCFTEQAWRMSPAYDITPINNSKQHGIGLGDDGRYASIDNLLSQTQRFGLNTSQANKIINEVKLYTQQWPTHFKRFANITDIDIARLTSVIPTIQ